MSQQNVTIKVNGKSITRSIEPDRLLSQFLREDLALTGTHIGCDTGQCGACTVHVNGHAVKSCTMLAVQAAGSSVTTIEGLAAADGTLHAMQAAFKECHGLQCGFCTPGMVMSAVDLVDHHGCHDVGPQGQASSLAVPPGGRKEAWGGPALLSESQVREALEGNFCRCTGYQNIVRAVQAGAAAMGAKA